MRLRGKSSTPPRERERELAPLSSCSGPAKRAQVEGVATPTSASVGVAQPMTPEQQQWAAYQQQWSGYNYGQPQQVQLSGCLQSSS